MKVHALASTLLAIALLARVPGAAAGQSPNSQNSKEAMQLFEHGKKLLEQGKAKEACAALKQSLDLEETINTLYQLGRCYEAQDRYLLAHESYLRAATMARTANDDKRGSIAQKRADDLKPKIPTLAVVVPPDARVPGLTIKDGDQALAQADWGKAMPVDPGEHMITATAPGYADWSKTVKAERSGGVSQVEVPALTPGASGSSAAPPPPPPPSYGEEPPPYTGPTERRSTGMFVAGVILIPVGGVSLIAGASLIGAAEAGAVTLGNSSVSARNAGIGVAILGVACIGAGIPLLVIGNQDVPVEQSGAEPPEEEASLVVGPGSAEFRLTF